MNPDTDFVMRGGSPPYWSRPGYMSNSQLTTTTHGLIDYDKRESKKLSDSLRNMSQNLSTMSASLKQSLLGKDSRVSYVYHPSIHESLCSNITDEELTQLMQRRNQDLENTAGLPKPIKTAGWCTTPRHKYLTKDSSSHVEGSTGRLGQLIDENVGSNRRVELEMGYKRLCNDDALVARYFPITLGAAYYLEAAAGNSVREFASQHQRRGRTPCKAKYCTTPLNKYRRAKSAARAEELLDFNENSNYRHDRRLLTMTPETPMIVTRPVTAPSLRSVIPTPYQEQLARLRKEQLLIEEDKLLELKRQEELERIRGPKPKWYEMKSREFHYEAHKNNQLMRSRDKWDDLLTYRGELMRASKDFSKSYEMLQTV